MSLQVTVSEKEKNVFVITPVGEINTDLAPEFASKVQEVLSSEFKIVIFDLKNLLYISSMGLGVLFRAKVVVKAKNGALMITNPQPQIQKVFDMVKFMPDQMLASLEQADECLDSFLDALQKGELNQDK